MWVVAFRQTAPFCWEAGGDLALDPGDPGSPNFSILEWLEECRSPDGDFHLMYRDERDDQFVMWQQATNPSTSQGAVGGFQVHGWGPGLKCDDSFGGLALLKGPHSLIGGVQNVPGGNGEVDGDGGKSGESFWYQLGARSFHQGAVPGMKTARTPYAHRVELLVGVEPTAVSKLVLKIAETARLSQVSCGCLSD